jgi:hypothetical protein
MASGSSAAKEGSLFDEKISKHLLPVSTVFTAEYVGLAASSTVPKVLHTQALLVDIQDNKEGARCIMESILFSSKASDNKITKNIKIACLHADLKSLIAKVLIVNCNTRALNIALQTPQSESASFSVDFNENDAVRSENSLPSPSSAAVQAEWMKSGYIIKKSASSWKEMELLLNILLYIRIRGGLILNKSSGTMCKGPC